MIGKNQMQTNPSQEFRSTITKELAKIKSGSQFLTIKGYQLESPKCGVADYSVLFHASYIKALEKAFNTVNDYTPDGTDCQKFSLDDLIAAKKELLASYLGRIKAHTIKEQSKNYKLKNVYCQVHDEDGKPIPGIKLHKNEDELHLEGYMVWKKIVIPNVPSKPVKSSGKTLAKRFLEGKTLLGKFVQFKLIPGKFDSLKVSGVEIGQEDVLREAKAVIGIAI